MTQSEDGWWDYSDSLLLYVTDSSAEQYEQVQQDESPYARLMTEPERKFLESIADEVATHILDGSDYIDLGPGTEHKEQLVFDALKRAEKKFRYVPVDITESYLERVTEYASAQGIETIGVHASFEELADSQKETERPRFVSLGATFANYEPQKMIRMLRDIAGTDGKAFIDVHIRDRVDMEELTQVYAHDIDAIVKSKLAFLDLQSEDVSEIEVDDGIRFWCTVNNPTEAMKAKGFEAGQKILLFQSLRYTMEQLEEELQKSGAGYTIIDTDQPFVGVIIE